MRRQLNAGAGLAVLLALVVPVSAQDAVSSAREVDENPEAGSNNRGITWPVALTTEVFGNLTGGTSRRAIGESLFRAGVDIDFTKVANLAGLSLRLSVLYAEGTGLTSTAVHDFNTLSNIDAYDSARLYEFWLQQEFAGGKLSIRLGQILADAEFFSSDYGALFINSSFGAIPLVSRNLNPPIFPVPAPGVRLRFDPSKSVYLEAAAFSGDAGESSTTNKHDTRLSFRARDGALIFAEVGYKTNAAASPSDPPGLTGTYKLGGFYDSKEFADIGEDGAHRGDYAVYFIADQEIWRPDGPGNRALSSFLTLGLAPNDRNTVTFYGDAGLNFRGLCAGRPQDLAGLGFSYVQLSPDLVQPSGGALASHHEAVLELTYQVACGEHLSLQPDLQFIFNPGAIEPAPLATVAGLRLNISF